MIENEEIRSIWERGKQNDLSNCHYGLFHDSKTYLETSPYYYFLSGLVSYSQARSVIEIGTFRGGSTKALAKGLAGHGVVITFDVKSFDPDFAGFPAVKSFIGDPLHPAALRFAGENCDGAVDVLFVDGAHDGIITLAQTLAYDRLFRPEWIVWDDVNLNASMQKFFATATSVFRGATDITAEHPYVRRPSEGFGVWKRNG